MKFSPTQNNPRVNLIFTALLVLGGITYAIPIVCSNNNINISALPFTMVTLFSVVGAVFLLVRYRMTSFTYIVRLRDDLDDGDAQGLEKAYAGSFDITSVKPELLDFCVYKASGTRMAAMECLLSLGDLVVTVEVTKKKSGGVTRDDVRREYEQKGGFVFYDYTLTFGLESALELVFIDGNRYVGVIIEPDESMRQYFLHLKR